jgi:hypothetical protein
MKRLIVVLAFCSLLSGCRYDQSQHTLSKFAFEYGDKEDTTSYPLMIEGGSKVVYQFGHMTPDKGLKLYFDTIATPTGGVLVDEAVRRQLSNR